MSEFTYQARVLLHCAQTEARLAHDESIDSGHLLAGLLRLHGESPVDGWPSQLFPDLDQARRVLAEQSRPPTLPARFTPEARRAIHLAADLALQRQQPVMALHVLLALIELTENRATRMLSDLGTVPEQIRVQIFQALPSPDSDLGVASPAALIGPALGRQPDKFTRHARQILVRAAEEAWIFEQRLDLEYLLLGLLCEPTGVAFQILKSLDTNLDTVEQTLAQILSQREQDEFVKLVFAPRGRRVITFAAQEAVRMRHHYLGTAHLLLGLLRLCEEEQRRKQWFSRPSRSERTTTGHLLIGLGLRYERALQRSRQFLGSPER